MSETITVALISVGSVVIGTAIPAVVNYFGSWHQTRSNTKIDNNRKKLLMKMLKDTRFKWRKLDTLTHVIGTDQENTKRLLLELDARASEDGQDLWGLITRNPFPGIQ